MMDVSVDTNVLIHLYSTGHKELLFSSFEAVYVHKYIIENELSRNNSEVYEQVKEDIAAERMIMIDNQFLGEKGIYELFDEHYRDYKNLFGGDRGEAYAIAMASVLGIEAFVSNDTKYGGPHETLLKELIDDIMPFAYYEIQFLKYIKDELSCSEYKEKFEQVAISMSRPMTFVGRVKSVLVRFHPSRGSERDLNWLNDFCQQHDVELSKKVRELGGYIKQLDN